MTLCPGREGKSVEGGTWDRDLNVDLEAFRAWKPDVIIALLEDHEYPGLGIPKFRTAVADADLPWIFAPMPDGGIPGADFDRVCVKEGQRIRSLLRNGGRILIHCRAGLGRTGLLAAVILVDFGESRKQQSRLYGRRGTIRSKHLLKNRT
jgi:ADP-ribosyl-[dinitrogen reductase] hydrolase